MRRLEHTRRLGTAAIACAALLGAVADAAVVTRRLGTGLPPAPAGAKLPEAWVAPADKVPVIDGKLDEAAWSKTRPVLLGKLESHGKATPRTEAFLVHTGGVLYVGVKLAEPLVADLKSAVRDADGPAYSDDSVELFLSPHPGRGYYQLIVSAGGGIYDRHGHGDSADWDAGAKAAVQVGADGWSLEVAVPMQALGVGEEMPNRWRANIYRNRRAGGQHQSQAFSPTFRGDYDVPARFGHWLFTPESPWAELEKVVDKQSGIEVDKLDDGTTVLSFDLQAIPAGAKVHRARLRCERAPIDGLNEDVLRPIEIYPLASPHVQGSRPRAADAPLKPIGPWYDAFDVTDLIRRCVAGQASAGVWVKRFPGWHKDRTFLDLMYEGEPEKVPRAVSDVQAFHRAGQTFITFREIDDPVRRDQITWSQLKSILGDLDRRRQTRYCIYRSTRPIMPETLPQAELIARLKPLSGWNLNGRNIGRSIDRFIATARVLNWHQWNPFRDAGIDGDYGRDCPIDRLVIRDGGTPLPRGTGLYVHTAAKDQRAYYAVVTAVDGVENTRDVRGGLNVVGPIDEKVAMPEPVLQGELPDSPFFHFAQKRLHYVRWVAPPLTNRPYDYHNWSVGVPLELQDGAALELNLHRDGYSYWRTHYRIEPGSVVLCPYDFPIKTFWYGYHECRGTLRPWNEGTIRNYTEKRLLGMIDWAARKWPVDRGRVLVTGCQGGASGSGALQLGLRYPGVFNMVIAGHGEPSYSGTGEPAERLWGKVDWGLRTCKETTRGLSRFSRSERGLSRFSRSENGTVPFRTPENIPARIPKTENAKSVWEDLDLIRRVGSLAPGAELPFVSMTYSSQQQQTDALAELLMSAGHPVVTHKAWGGQRMIPVSATATNWCLPLDIRRDRAMLAISADGKTGDAVRNGSLLWQTADMVDEPARFAVTLRQATGEFNGTITLRRLQRLTPQTGRRYAWKLDPIEVVAGRGGQQPQPAEGTVTVGSDRLIRLRDIHIAQGTHRLTITASK